MHGFFYGVCLGHRAFRFKSSFLWAFHCNHSRKNFEDFSWILRQYLFRYKSSLIHRCGLSVSIPHENEKTMLEIFV